MNYCMIVGHLTKAPQIRTTQNGKTVATFTVAVNRRFNREETDFLQVVVWGSVADNCGKYLNKGSQVAVCGSIQTRSYETESGDKRYVTEINASEVEFLSRSKHEENIADDPDIEVVELSEEGLPF